MIQIELPNDWCAAIDALRAAKARRVVVMGPTDAGKSSFILAAAEKVERQPVIVDPDPGQKMIGAPGTISRGTVTEGDLVQEEFVFLGTTSAILIGRIAGAVQRLTTKRDSLVLVNTPGFISGPGIRLQSAIIKAAAADALVMIGEHPALNEIAAVNESIPAIRIQRAPAARRKSDAARRSLRQAAFERAFEGADTLFVPTASVHIAPAPLLPWTSERRPVCSVADAAGNDVALGIITTAEGMGLHIWTSAKSASLLRLGHMWAEPRATGGWKLVDQLTETWQTGEA